MGRGREWGRAELQNDSRGDGVEDGCGRQARALRRLQNIPNEAEKERNRRRGLAR